MSFTTEEYEIAKTKLDHLASVHGMTTVECCDSMDSLCPKCGGDGFYMKADLWDNCGAPCCPIRADA